MREAGKSWSLYVFSSANALRLYSASSSSSDWASPGCGSVSRARTAPTPSCSGADTRELVRELQSHGIRVLGSSIIGLPEHTSENLDAAIDHAVAHDTEFHQFMLYTPIPGTPLHAEHLAQGTLLSGADCPEADAHGQLRFNFRHPHLHGGEETGFLLRAFERDFAVNGPSLVRIARTLLQGWLRHHDHPEPRVRERFARECAALPTVYAAALWAAERWPTTSAALAGRIRAVRAGLVGAFGWKARLTAPLLGRLILLSMHREHRWLQRGHTYEPPTFFETLQPWVAPRQAAAGEAV